MNQMKISELKLTLVKPSESLVGFASCIINESLYIGSMGVHKRLLGGVRIVYPRYVVKGRKFNYYHPINNELSKLIESELVTKYSELSN